MYKQEINKPYLNIEVNNKSTKMNCYDYEVTINPGTVATEMQMLAIVSSVFFTVKKVSFVHIWIRRQWVQLYP